ncbi:MAG: UbiA prenyltransferase family protein [Planctomycetota bacterium]
MASDTPAKGGVGAYIRLARPQQWAKSGFVLLGPLYHLTTVEGAVVETARSFVMPGLAAALAFALASSACYAVNDILDAPRDREHPKKRLRPIASGAVSVPGALVFAILLYAASLLCLLLVAQEHRLYTLLGLVAYVGNVNIYSLALKHRVIADVIGLSLGFVIRVVGGCLAVGITPSTWLLNATLFLAMFLAFGKRLGERRTMGEDAPKTRKVQARYTDDTLRMAVVATAVIALFSYASYTAQKDAGEAFGTFNLLWLTVLPATYGMMRCFVLVESGEYDDPTDLAIKDRGFQLAGLVFVLLSVLAFGL